MKRLHVNVGVEDLAASVRFYTTLFAAEPAVVKDDYAKWMLDDPRVNFAISARNARAGRSVQIDPPQPAGCRHRVHLHAHQRPAASGGHVQ